SASASSKRARNSSSTSYEGRAMHGPTAAAIRSRFAPSCSIASIVASVTPATAPLQPACSAPILLASWSAKRTAALSALSTPTRRRVNHDTHPDPSASTIASRPRRPPARPDDDVRAGPPPDHDRIRSVPVEAAPHVDTPAALVPPRGGPVHLPGTAHTSVPPR